MKCVLLHSAFRGLLIKFCFSQVVNLAKVSVMDDVPSLFGLHKSNTNKDLQRANAWGKNSFNNCFPVSLLCYMQSRNIPPVYLSLSKNWDILIDKIDVNSTFGHTYDAEDIFFAFEYIWGKNQQLVKGALPRIDLVVMKNSDSDIHWLRALEIKLTALPDNSTCNLSDDKHGCELVVRPNTIIHLTLEIASKYANHRKDLAKLLRHAFQNDLDWEVENKLLKQMPHIVQTLKNILLAKVDSQNPFVIQPIWKTVGKSAQLHTHCLDVFVWSSFAFTKLLLDAVEQERSNKFSRAKRAVLWIMKMLSDFANMVRLIHKQFVLGFPIKQIKPLL